MGSDKIDREENFGLIEYFRIECTKYSLYVPNETVKLATKDAILNFRRYPWDRPYGL